MARPKKTTVTLGSIEECQQAMRRLLLATLEIEQVTAAREEAAAAAMRPYDKRLEMETERAKDLEVQLQQYYMTHLADLEKDGRKSVKLLYGVMGRRLGNKALKLANKSWTWEAVREAIRAKWGTGFLSFADPEVDRDKVKTEMPEERLAECGLKLTQDAKFYAEPDRAAEVQP